MPSKKQEPSTRRQFLKQSARLGMALFAAPWIVPASALGANGTTAPSNRLTLGYIGLGKMGMGHFGNCLNSPEFQVLAVCDVEELRLEIARKEVDRVYGSKGCAAYHDFRDLLSRQDIDAVFISTPDHWHAIQCIEAAKARKDIYCEKPMVHTIREGRAVVEAVRRYGRVFQTGSQQRSEYQGMFRQAAEIVRNGKLGEIKAVHVQVGGPGEACYLPAQPVPEGLDWDFWVGPAPWRPFNAELCPAYHVGGFPNWRGYYDFGGGGLFDFGAHHFDIAQWALDMDDSGPVEIIPPDGKDHPRLTFIYANGVPMYHGGGRNDVEFIGTEGRLHVGRGSIGAEPASLLTDPLSPSEIRLNRNKGHKADWLHCIRTRQRPIADVEIGHRTASVCHLAFIAYTLKRPLKWDPVREHFVNDPEADRMLGYGMRSPWHL